VTSTTANTPTSSYSIAGSADIETDALAELVYDIGLAQAPGEQLIQLGAAQ
jgi:hypothetical protein